MEPAHKTDTPERSEAEQLAFFDAMLDGWRAAAARASRVVVHLDVAGTRVELAFAGDALATPLLPALAHLIVPADAPPDATFCCWDSRSTGVPAVPPPCGREGFTERGDLWGMNSARVRSAFHWHEFSVNVMDLERRTAVFWVDAAAQLPYWSKASPLRTLFHWWTEANGAQLLHAAAVGGPDGAVLVTGRGGVGKSSTALACLAAGMQYVADDYLVVRLDPAPRVYSLYSTAKLDPGQLARFPTLRAHAVAPDAVPAGEKAVLHLVPALAAQVARSLPLRAIATPVFGDAAETTLAPASRTALQRAASFTTLSQLPGAGRGTHATIERLVAALPGVTLRLGHDRARVPDAVRALLALDDASLRALAAPVSGGPAARPVVSVVVPVFNGVPFLERCIANILAQDCAPLEILVVDDGSTDDVERAVRALPVDVRFFRQANAGPAAARNRGLREASGDLIAFLDVDDYWPAGNLTTLVERLAAHPEAMAVHGAAQVVRAGVDGAPDEYVGGTADAFPFYIGAGLYRREAFARVGPFDAELRFGEDSDWFHRARERALPILRADEVTLFVRRHDANMTRGRTLVEVSTLRVFKKALDRRRAAAAEAPQRGVIVPQGVRALRRLLRPGADDASLGPSTRLPDPPPGERVVRRLLVTGAAGGVAALLRPRLAARYPVLRLLDVRRVERAAPSDEIVRADVADRAAVARAMRGCDAVLHLAAVAREATFARLARANLDGVRSVLDAAHAHGVRRVVLASTMHVLGMYARDEPLPPDAEPRPDSLYAVSKLFAEDLGRLYVHKHGLEVACVRIGHLAARCEDAEPGSWIGPDDLAALIAALLAHPDVRFATVPGVAIHDGDPLGQAEASARFGMTWRHPGPSYADALARAAGWFAHDPVALRWRGGVFASATRPMV